MKCRFKWYRFTIACICKRNICDDIDKILALMYCNEATIYLLPKKMSNALYCANNALKLFNHCAQAHHIRAEIFRSKFDFNEALSDLSMILDKDDEHQMPQEVIFPLLPQGQISCFEISCHECSPSNNNNNNNIIIMFCCAENRKGKRSVDGNSNGRIEKRGENIDSETPCAREKHSATSFS